MLVKSSHLLPFLIVAATLTGCKDSSDNKSSKKADDHQKAGFNISDAGRLMISDADNAAVTVFSLEKGVALETFSLANKASALHASPGYRYGLATYRNASGSVEIIDGGKYQEDHGDHMHPYEKDPTKLSVTLSGANPTHYETHDGRGAIFFDGVEGVVSKVVEFTDALLAAGKTNSFDLASNHHGTAEPLGDHILVSNKGDSTTSLPQKVDLFHFHKGEGFEKEKTFDTLCPELHGSFSTKEGSVFGCKDGVLVVKEGADHSFSAAKIANIAAVGNSRIGSFSGFAKSHIVGGWAGDKLFAIDLEKMSMEQIDWNGQADVAKNTAHMAATGEYLLVLDATGTLHILSGAEHEHDDKKEAADKAEKEHEEHAFEPHKTVKVLNTMPEPVQGHGGLRQPRVSVVSSPASDFAYVVDATAKQVAVVHLKDGEVEKRIALTFKPAYATWVGIASAKTDHKHDH